jgi:murein DD-endopeptidase MepM/ murein hydrolase activator NlpD
LTTARDTQEPVRKDFSFEGSFAQGGLVIGTTPSGTTSLALDGKPVPIAADGRFAIAFDRDAGPSATLVAISGDGVTTTRSIAVATRAWDVEHVDIARTASTPSAAFEALRAPELVKINAARQIDSVSDGWRQRFIWPVRGRISGVFGSQRIYRGEPGAYHSGVDIAPGGSGALVVAPADGVVVLAADKPFTLEGNLVIVDHGMGLNSAFLHLSRIDVHEGQRLKRGDPIGAVGMTGRATGPHLHWAMKWRLARIDPQVLAGPMPGFVPGKPPVATDDGRN